jgi:hypothetical protein
LVSLPAGARIGWVARRGFLRLAATIGFLTGFAVDRTWTADSLALAAVLDRAILANRIGQDDTTRAREAFETAMRTALGYDFLGRAAQLLGSLRRFPSDLADHVLFSTMAAVVATSTIATVGWALTGARVARRFRVPPKAGFPASAVPREVRPRPAWSRDFVTADQFERLGRTVTALAPLIALIGTITTAYFGYLGAREAAARRAAEVRPGGNGAR